MSELNEALKKIEATEANLVKLEKIWKELANLVPIGRQVSYTQDDVNRYETLSRHFQRILSAMPKIDGYEIPYRVMPFHSVLRNNIDYLDLDEISATLSFEEEVYSQGTFLAEYRFKLVEKRQELARLVVFDIAESIEADIALLKTIEPDSHQRINHPAWDEMEQKLKSIGAIIGNSVVKPGRWSTIMRHISYRQIQDLSDIENYDWPSIRMGLTDALRQEFDPLSVEIEDIGTLVAKKPSGKVVTELKWQILEPSDFERLIFNLIVTTDSYENPQWLTHTNAPDRGRDLSTHRVYKDPLSGTQRQRVVIACKHYTAQSVSVNEVGLLRTQVELWEPPKVDVLIIATSGRFTTDAVQLIENNNQKPGIKIEMWPSSTLEHLLAERPAIIAEFKLR